MKGGKGELMNSNKANEYYKLALNTKDSKKRLDYLIKASNKNHKHATLLVGYAYEDGDGTSPNDELAIKYYKKAIKLNYPLGYEALGMMYQLGNGVKQSNLTAYKYYKKAKTSMADLNMLLLETYFYDEIKNEIEDSDDND